MTKAQKLYRTYDKPVDDLTHLQELQDNDPDDEEGPLAKLRAAIQQQDIERFMAGKGLHSEKTAELIGIEITKALRAIERFVTL